jgi:hypothetical protein
VPVDVEGAPWLGAIPPESNPKDSESSNELDADAGVDRVACDEAVPRSASIAPKKARSADTRSTVFALSARARAAAMREPRGSSDEPRSGGGDEDLMAIIEAARSESRLKAH